MNLHARRTTRVLDVIILLITLTSINVWSQIVPGEGMESGLGGANILVGTVYTPTGQRMNTRVTIRLTTMTRGDRVSATDENGNFAFRGLPAGTYTIVIDKEKDFEPLAQVVEIIQLRGSPPQTYTLSIRLSPKARTDSKPGILNAAVANLPDRGRQLFSKAQEFTNSGDHKSAIEQLLVLTNEFPTFMLGFNELGVAYLRLNELEKADEMFRTAIRIEPEAFAPLMNRGIALVSMKKYSDAEPVLRAARKIDEKSAVVHYFLGQALANLGKFDEAERELSMALATGTDQMKEAHRILAIIYSSRGDRKRAAVELESYLKIAPNAPDAEQLRRVLQQLREAGADSSQPPKKPGAR